MPKRACGNSSCTACARTCAVGCRRMARPSGLSIVIGSTESPSATTLARSRCAPLTRAAMTVVPTSCPAWDRTVAAVVVSSADTPGCYPCGRAVSDARAGTLDLVAGEECRRERHGAARVGERWSHQPMADREVILAIGRQTERRGPAVRLACVARAQQPDALYVELVDDRSRVEMHNLMVTHGCGFAPPRYAFLGLRTPTTRGAGPSWLS